MVSTSPEPSLSPRHPGPWGEMCSPRGPSCWAGESWGKPTLPALNEEGAGGCARKF